MNGGSAAALDITTIAGSRIQEMSPDTNHGRHKASAFGYGPVSDEHRKKQEQFARAKDDRDLGELIPVEEVIEDE